MAQEALASSHAAMPYRADVIGYDQESVFSPVIFQIRVAHETGVHFVWHRYNAFKQLSAYLSHRFPALPTLQGGHLWQKAVNSAGFLKSRQHCLTSFLQAALTLDADVEDVILREFLGIASPALAELSEAPVELENSEPSRGRSCSSLDKFSARPNLQRHSCTGAFRAEEMSICRVKRCLSSPLPADDQLEEASHLLANSRFNEAAVVIARDVSRVFPSNSRVHDVRIEIAEILRAYAREDPDLGYTQGMCFAAAVVAVGDGNLEGKQQRFSQLMEKLRDLWMPGFPLVEQGIPVVESMLASKDPELMHHLYQTIKMDLGMVIPSAWLSVFGKWLPLDVLQDLVPFLQKEGLAGFVIVTFLMLLAHRSKLLVARSLDEILPFINSFSKEAVPDQLLSVCQAPSRLAEAPCKGPFGRPGPRSIDDRMAQTLKNEGERERERERAMKAMKAMKAARAAPKGEIAKQLAESTGLKKSDVMSVLDTLADIGTKELKKAGKFTLPGLVMIKTRKKKATKAGKRMMFGKEVKVKAQPAKTVVKAFPVKAVKDEF
ncbi:Major basic nuclear protein 2 [Symbiodinium microadriaticum]|uniref:Major basic nuclear protein 2 n=1 Tax=Symbiodinium microadriaticum TaxID=2951 RepID=A0A1Q9EH06_SYMMI|nr:Major basic nuclear protein 2 [Symbiodinium microadriaticum]